MAQAVVQATGVTKSYGSLQVLKGVDFTLYQGEVVSITGPSGAGKSTLLHIAGTLDRADSGNIMIQGQEMASLPSRQLSRFRNRHIGFIFQFHHLLPEFTALENVCIPAWVAQQSKNEAADKARKLLNLMGLQDRMDHKPAQMSGGEQQRVAVARALVNDPLVVFADEPSGNLDSQHAREMHQLFFRLREELNQTFLIVTHNDELAAMSDRKLVMKDGLMQ